MLTALSSPPFYTNYVWLSTATNPVPPKIFNDPQQYPFFCNAIGVIDGTHIICSPSEREQDAGY